MANEALIDFLSGALNASRRNVCIVSGLASRTRKVEFVARARRGSTIDWV